MSGVYQYRATKKFAVKLDGKQVFQVQSDVNSL